MIQLQNICVSLPPESDSARTILRNVSLHVARGDWITLVGPNGSGKTTLLKTAAGLLPPSSGTIQRADGGPRSTGLLLQEADNLFVAGSVRSELLLSIPPNVDDRATDDRIQTAAERFSLNGLLHRNPHRLSGGEKQRLALATVWLAEPDLLLLDEPTSCLDARERERCHRFVKELNESGVAVVWATPEGGDIDPSSRVVYMEAGEVRDAPSHRTGDEYATGGAVAEDGPVEAGELASAVREEIILSLCGVSFAYEEEAVLRDISLDVHAGECVGVTGRNGSGKSTLLSLMSGVLEPTVGSVRQSARRGPERDRQDVFHLFQSPERLFFAETVFEEVAFGLRSLGVARSDIPQRVAEALARAGLEPAAFLDRMPFTLSFGEMRRVAFAIAAALNPRLLILDEPSSCLDISGRRLLFRFIRQALEGGCAVVIASHDMRAISPIATRCIEL